ncbi:uncharacterized protein LOC135816568 [Sycon ciliatum]|uniref:uncharacterized protein LOC135816568 n=1 Tax=Sycon ciliatum TaxID=27933 RepID=UPI0031F6A0BF
MGSLSLLVAVMAMVGALTGSPLLATGSPVTTPKGLGAIRNASLTMLSKTRFVISFLAPDDGFNVAVLTVEYNITAPGKKTSPGYVDLSRHRDPDHVYSVGVGEVKSPGALVRVAIFARTAQSNGQGPSLILKTTMPSYPATYIPTPVKHIPGYGEASHVQHTVLSSSTMRITWRAPPAPFSLTTGSQNPSPSYFFSVFWYDIYYPWVVMPMDQTFQNYSFCWTARINATMDLNQEYSLTCSNIPTGRLMNIAIFTMPIIPRLGRSQYLGKHTIYYTGTFFSDLFYLSTGQPQEIIVNRVVSLQLPLTFCCAY